MSAYAQSGGLWLPQMSADERFIQRELERLDPDLFLDKTIDRAYEAVVWRVMHQVSAERVVEAFEWRDDYGRPLPLSSGILDRARRQEGAGARAVEAAIANNKAIQDAIDREAEYVAQEAARDVGPRLSGLRSAVLPRSQALRMSRDKRRARGERV